MKRSKAIKQVRQHSPGVNSQNTCFANSNSKTNICWFDIPSTKRLKNTHINLLIYDRGNNSLSHLEFPSEYLNDRLSSVYIRPDNKSVTLYLSMKESNRFQDIHSCGDKINFKHFLRNEYSDLN
jgi:hypothetical protein